MPAESLAQGGSVCLEEAVKDERVSLIQRQINNPIGLHIIQQWIPAIWHDEIG